MLTDDRRTRTEQGALPSREGRPRRKDEEADARRGAAWARDCRKLRGPETNPNPHRHGRHPKDKREGAPHQSILEPAFPARTAHGQGWTPSLGKPLRRSRHSRARRHREVEYLERVTARIDHRQRPTGLGESSAATA